MEEQTFQIKNLGLRDKIMVKEKLENSRVKLTFDVTPEEFESALDKAFVVENAKVTIHGFRAGKAPRSVFEKHYGVDSLYQEALNVVIDNKIREVLADKELAEQICSQFEPDIDDKIERGKDFKLYLSFDVLPEVKLPNYKGIEVKKQV